jgi:hypothetical protein
VLPFGGSASRDDASDPGWRHALIVDEASGSNGAAVPVRLGDVGWRLSDD